MDTTLNTPKSQRPFLAGFWLIIAIPVFVLVALPFMQALGVDDIYTPVGITVMLVIHFFAGYMWAQSIGLRSGLPYNRMMNIFGGLGFAIGVVGLLVLYSAGFPIENTIDR